MTNALRAVVALGSLIPCVTAHSQALSYHHRSTAEGDRISAGADYEAANGKATLHRAQAYDRRMDAEAKLMELEYQYYQFRRQMAYDQLEWRERRAQTNRQRQAEQELKLDAAALTLLNRVQLGLQVWPEALSHPEYASSMSTIESILKTWRQSPSASDAFAARAMVTEVAVLDARIVADKTLSHPSRCRAVRSLRLVQRIPYMKGTELPAPTAWASTH